MIRLLYERDFDCIESRRLIRVVSVFVGGLDAGFRCLSPRVRDGQPAILLLEQTMYVRITTSYQWIRSYTVITSNGLSAEWALNLYRIHSRDRRLNHGCDADIDQGVPDPCVVGLR